jgi:Mycothiol maleylpyruvate isomerase N-terminal domain
VSKTEFLADIRSARAELEKVLAGRDERTLDAVTVPGLSWTSKEVLAHLIGYDLAVRNAIADVRAGRTWTWGWAAHGFDEWNERQVGPRRARGYASVRAELDASRTDLLAELERWPEDAGPFGTDTWDATKSEIGWIGPHEREHAEVIAKL